MQVLVWPRCARVVTAVTVAVLAAAGCGGDDEGDKKAADALTSTSESGQSASTSEKKAKAPRRKRRQRSDKAKKDASPKPPSEAKLEEDQREVKKATKKFLGRLPSPERIQFTKNIATSTLRLFGFNGAKVRVGATGKVVTISVPKSQACKAGIRDPAVVAKRIRDSVPTVTTVPMVIAGSGSPLGRYIAANCKGQSLPGGPGQTVFTLAGDSTVARTKEFRVRSRRWSIDYRNDGQILTVFVLKGSKTLPFAVSATERGTGTKKVTAGPGKYRLRIIGSAGWTVRVRDAG